MTGIEPAAFTGCTRLTSFSVDRGNSGYTAADGALYQKNYAQYGAALIAYPAGAQAETFTVPTGIDVIAPGAFSGAKLVEIVLSEGVKVIGAQAFLDCAALRRVTFPDSVEALEASLFDGCANLQSIVCGSTSYAYQALVESGFGGYIEGGAEIVVGDWTALPDSGDGCVITQYAGSATALTIPDRLGDTPVTGIGAQVFLRRSALKSVVIPDSVTWIGDSAFSSCTSLTSVTLGAGIKTVRDSAFSFCASLPQIAFPEGLETIGENAFYACSSLQSIMLPQSLTTIGAFAFGSCEKLVSAVLPEGLTSIGEGALSGCSDALIVYVARGSYAEAWAKGEKLTNLVRFDEAYADPEYDWADDYSAVTARRTSILFPNDVQTETIATVRTLGKAPTRTARGSTKYTAAFTNTAFGILTATVGDIPALNDLSVLELPAGLTRIEASAFEGVSAQALLIPDSCVEIADGAFAGCERLIYVRLSPDCIVSNTAFAGCEQIRLDTGE